MAQSKPAKSSKKDQKASEAVKAKKDVARSQKEVVEVSDGENESTSEVESTSSSGSDSSGSESESDEESTGTEEQSQKKLAAAIPPPEPARVPTLAFTPPDGFRAASTASIPSSKAARLFSPSNLTGKQLWHITAPASVPIESIKEVALENVLKGETVLSHKGAEYGFSINETPAETNTKLLVPSINGDGYQLAPDDVTQTLHLHQLVRIPNLPHADGFSSKKAGQPAFKPAKKPVRQQPDGLKMRFFPSGTGIGSDSDTEMADAEDATSKEFRMPVEVEQSSRKEKRKLQEVNGTQESEEHVLSASKDEEARRKKHKHKHKSDKENEGESKEERGRKEEAENEGDRRRETGEERAKRKHKEKKREEKSKSKEKKSSKH